MHISRSIVSIFYIRTSFYYDFFFGSQKIFFFNRGQFLFEPFFMKFNWLRFITQGLAYLNHVKKLTYRKS